MEKLKVTNKEIKDKLGKMIYSGKHSSIKEAVEHCVRNMVSLENADLENAILEGANLNFARLQGANLENAILNFAILKGANLKGANLNDANLKGANLNRVNLNLATLQGASLEGANLDRTNLDRANLNGAILIGATLQGANLNGTNLNGATLQGANLNGTNLNGANLNGANISQVKGIEPQSQFLEKLTKNNEGYISFKTIRRHSVHKAKEGLELTETVNFNRTNPCGCGIGSGTAKWVFENADGNTQNNMKPIYVCVTPYIHASDLIVPYNSNGKFRGAYLKLLKKISFKQLQEIAMGKLDVLSLLK